MGTVLLSFQSRPSFIRLEKDIRSRTQLTYSTSCHHQFHHNPTVLEHEFKNIFHFTHKLTKACVLPLRLQKGACHCGALLPVVLDFFLWHVLNLIQQDCILYDICHGLLLEMNASRRLRSFFISICLIHVCCTQCAACTISCMTLVF